MQPPSLGTPDQSEERKQNTWAERTFPGAPK